MNIANPILPRKQNDFSLNAWRPLNDKVLPTNLLVHHRITTSMPFTYNDAPRLSSAMFTNSDPTWFMCSSLIICSFHSWRKFYKK